ncbi:hypothetical protein BDA99DRAFT_536695 [Phascolomyces articulosus]|uniref:Heterokaryon incompatibility domain-containing protein n=1 Tax=Phascolomyces articulosus TaxID=60185 RepID=A0AAD5KCE7_9FUNG|nr:hypothetical protein BDA99DRAFT_536695 [Phascolomyces articulosus]
MVYIKYETRQWATAPKSSLPHYDIWGERLDKYYLPPKRFPDTLPKPEVMPTHLIRISDMEVVNGSDIDEGYCALSYSWNQTGCIIKNKLTKMKAMKVDQGKHKIIHTTQQQRSCRQQNSPVNNNDNEENGKRVPLKGIYKNVVHKLNATLLCGLNYFITFRQDQNKKEEHHPHDDEEEEENNDVVEVKYVRFEGIIQQLCKDFNIKYLWYDQLCINQHDQNEKQLEIRKMHQIYSNAYCTVAFVPEFRVQQKHHNIKPNIPNFLRAQQLLQQHTWAKRLWTLEEAILSKKLLIVGGNVHMWDEELNYLSKLHALKKSLSELSVQEILHHAHQRTSTKVHDRVFALIHLFPDISDKINIDYNQPIKDLMIRFYSLLAEQHIGILAFKKNQYDDNRSQVTTYQSKIQKYKFLPSWTGAHGKHSRQVRLLTTTPSQNYKVIGKTMHITSTYVTNGQFFNNSKSFNYYNFWSGSFRNEPAYERHCVLVIKSNPLLKFTLSPQFNFLQSSKFSQTLNL